MQPDQFNDISYQLDDQGIVTVTLSTPARKNALSAITFYEIWCAARHFQEDDAAHAMIITGAPGGAEADREAFSSGGYFSPDAFEGVPEEVMADIDLTDIAQKRVVLEMFQCDKPILAAVNGLAIGGAVTLVLAVADQIIMSEHAWLQLPFAKLGIAAELGSTYFLPRLLGLQKAKEILFYPERIDAAAAVGLGIASRVVAHPELMEVTRERTLQLIPPRGAGLAIREMKRALNGPQVAALSAALDQENAALAKLFKSGDFAEGIGARVERRDPVFQGA